MVSDDFRRVWVHESFLKKITISFEESKVMMLFDEAMLLETPIERPAPGAKPDWTPLESAEEVSPAIVTLNDWTSLSLGGLSFPGCIQVFDSYSEKLPGSGFFRYWFHVYYPQGAGGQGNQHMIEVVARGFEVRAAACERAAGV